MLLLCRTSDWVVFICRERWTSFNNTGSHSTRQHHCYLSGLGQFTQTGSVHGLRRDLLTVQSVHLDQLVEIWVMSYTVRLCARGKRTKWISLIRCWNLHQLFCLIYHVVSCVVWRGQWQQIRNSLKEDYRWNWTMEHYCLCSLFYVQCSAQYLYRL